MSPSLTYNMHNIKRDHSETDDELSTKSKKMCIEGAGSETNTDVLGKGNKRKKKAQDRTADKKIKMDNVGFHDKSDSDVHDEYVNAPVEVLRNENVNDITARIDSEDDPFRKQPKKKKKWKDWSSSCGDTNSDSGVSSSARQKERNHIVEMGFEGNSLSEKRNKKKKRKNKSPRFDDCNSDSSVPHIIKIEEFSENSDIILKGNGDTSNHSNATEHQSPNTSHSRSKLNIEKKHAELDAVDQLLAKLIHDKDIMGEILELNASAENDGNIETESQTSQENSHILNFVKQYGEFTNEKLKNLHSSSQDMNTDQEIGRPKTKKKKKQRRRRERLEQDGAECSNRVVIKTESDDSANVHYEDVDNNDRCFQKKARKKKKHDTKANGDSSNGIKDHRTPPSTNEEHESSADNKKARKSVETSSLNESHLSIDHICERFKSICPSKEFDQMCTDLENKLDSLNVSQELHKEEYKHIKIRVGLEVSEGHTIETRIAAGPTPQQRAELEEKGVDTSKRRFTAVEDKILKHNWKCFYRSYDVENAPIIFTNLKVLPVSQRIPFVQYLGRNLPKRSLHSIFGRFRTLYQHDTKGKFTAEENITITSYLDSAAANKNSEDVYSKLAKVLNRSRNCVRKHCDYIANKKSPKLANRDIEISIKQLMRICGVAERKDLVALNIENKHWKELENAMNHPFEKLRKFWYLHVYWRLLHTKVDLYSTREEINNILIENEERDWRSVNWEKVAQQMKEKFHPSFLYYHYKRLVNTERVPTKYKTNLEKAAIYLRDKYFRGQNTKHRRTLYNDGPID